MNSISPLQPLELDSKGCPKNPEKANGILRTLLDYLPSPDSDPGLVKKNLACLVQTTFTQNTNEEKQALELYKEVFKKFPDFFPPRTSKEWVTIECGEKKSTIPKNLLVAESDVLRAQLQSSMQGVQREIVVKIESEKGSIYDHLTQEPLTLSGDNVLEIYQYANEYCLAALERRCMQFLKENLSRNNLEAVTDFAILTQNADLILISLEFVQKNFFPFTLGKKLSEFLKGENNQFRKMALTYLPFFECEFVLDARKITLIRKPNPDTREELIHFNKLLQVEVLTIDVQNLPIKDEKEIIEGFSSAYRKLLVSTSHGKFKCVDEVVAYVQNFDEKKHQIDLDLRDIPDLNDEKLLELSKYLPDELYAIHINSPEITFVPRAKYIHCSDCINLKTLEVPGALEVTCVGCKKLEILKAPQATSITCQDCSSLAQLSAVKVREVNCNYCVELATLDLPEATNVNCRGCAKLMTLVAPKAAKISCCSCDNLTQLIASIAIQINCSSCNNLKKLSAPKAIEIICYNCPELMALEAPVATEVISFGCTKLAVLHVSENVFV